MALSVDSKIKEILKNPDGAAVMEKFEAGFAANPSIKMVQGLTLRALLEYPQSADLAAKMDEIDVALKNI